MKNRTNNPGATEFELYGGRGVTVCDEWKNSFEAFRDWALANGYDDTLTLDRIDVNGNYCPQNCRWATVKEQSRNRQNNHFITYNGEKKTLSEWAEVTGINCHTIYDRLSHGWSVEETLTTPPGGKRKKK